MVSDDPTPIPDVLPIPDDAFETETAIESAIESALAIESATAGDEHDASSAIPRERDTEVELWLDDDVLEDEDPDGPPTLVDMTNRNPGSARELY